MKVNEEVLKSAGELAAELATMHGVLYVLITEMRTTQISVVQAELIDAAAFELRQSQEKFLAKYADTMGGAAPEQN